MFVLGLSAVAFALDRIAQLRTPAAIRPFRCGRACSFLVSLQLRLRLFALRSCAVQQPYARIAGPPVFVLGLSAVPFVRIVQLGFPAAVRPYRCAARVRS